MSRKAGVYCRISQDRVGAGLGVERQQEDCCELAARLDLDVVGTYVDNDTSAYSGKRRPAYERLLDDIRDGTIDAVLAWHTDRLHRSPVELERYIETLDPRGVPTYTVRAGALDLSSAAGRMHARISGAVARHESEQKGERVKRAKQQAQLAGKWLGGRRPFGFEADGVTVHDVEAAAIREGSRRVLLGDSMRSVAAEWNAAGLTTVTGKAWTGASVRDVLLRPRNAGLIGNRDRVLGDAAWPAIIDRETWEALRALAKDPSRLTHAGTGVARSRKLIGSFLYFCECGDHLCSGGQRVDNQPRYACVNNHLRRLAKPIDDLVLGVVGGVLVRENIALIAPDEDTSPLRDRLAVLQTRAEEIASLLGDPTSGMTAAQFKAANERVQAEMRQVETQLARASRVSPLHGIADATDPQQAFLDAGIDRQRAVIDILARVVVKPVGPGRRSGGGYFDPDSVVITPKYGDEAR